MTPEEQARAKASKAYHDDPRNPSTCETFKEIRDRPCTCEESWRRYMPKEQT